MHVHCGGRDASKGFQHTVDCFAMAVEADGALQISAAAPLPSESWANPCYGSDGERLVIAGGLAGGNDTYSEIMFLDGLDTTWRKVAAQLGTPKRNQGGVLLGDTLVCLGGKDEVSIKKARPTVQENYVGLIAMLLQVNREFLQACAMLVCLAGVFHYYLKVENTSPL